MRFSLVLELKKNIFPIEYRKIILSYIKNALSNCNEGKFFKEFFGDIAKKEYCFSVIFPKSKFEKDKIFIEKNEIKILFSSSDRNKSGLKLYSAFLAQKNKVFPLENNNYMFLKSIKNEKREEILNTRAIFNTTLGSGICVRDHNRETNKDKYYIYSEDGFREKLNIVLESQLRNAGYSTEDIKNVVINFIQCKSAVAKHYKRYIDVTIGMIEVRASRSILQYLYDIGLGSRKSAGFGMLDLVTQDLH